MKLLGALAISAALLSTTAAHAQYNLNIDMHGERGTNGAIDATFFNVSSDGSGSPSGAYLTLTPYFTPGVYQEFVPSEDFVVSSQFGQGSSSGQIISYSFMDTKNGDNFNLTYDQDVNSPYYQDPTFTANINGQTVFAYPQESAFEGGFVNYSVSSAPEPAAWLLLILGTGLTGSILHRRRLWGKRATP